MRQISWSRAGFVAYIAQEKVYVTWLKCLDGARRELAPPFVLPFGSIPSQIRWASTHDLAVSDLSGRIQIFEILPGGGAEARSPLAVATGQTLHPAELNAVVDMYWLSSERTMALPASISPLNDDGSSSKPIWQSVKAQGPVHPVASAGTLLAVTGNGLLRALIELGDRTFREVNVVLEDAGHVKLAAFVPSPQGLLLAVYLASHKITVYRLYVDFSPELVPGSKAVPVTPATLRAVPATSVVAPAPSGAQLHSFEFMRRWLNDNPSEQSQSYLCVVYNQAEKGVMHKYLISETIPALHPAMEQIFGKVQAHQVAMDLRPTPENGVTYEKRIQEITIRRTAVLLHFEDGTIQAERLLAAPLLLPHTQFNFDQETTENLAKASSLEMSPNLCAVAYTRAGDASEEPAGVTVSFLKCVEEKLEMRKGFDVATAITSTYAFSVYNNTNSADLLGVAWQLFHREIPLLKVNSNLFFGALLAEAQRLLNVSFEPPEDPRHVERTSVIPSPLQRWLIFQLTLGTGANWKRTPGGSLAWIALNIQLIVFAITWTLKVVTQQSKAKNQQQQMAELSTSCSHIVNVLGLVRWTTDLVAHITRELFLATMVSSEADQPQAQGPQHSAATRYLADHPMSFVNVMLSKILRFLLVYIMRGIRSLQQVLQKLVEQELALLGQPGNAHVTQKRLLDIVNSAPVSLSLFERILSDVDKHLKTIYSSDKLQERVKRMLEMELLKNQKTPKVLLPIIEHIVKTFNARVVGVIDVPRLYFYDTEWLNVESSPEGRQAEQVDTIRKTIISGNDTARRCSRCGCISVLEPQKAPSRPDWSLLFSRCCFCGGLWYKTGSTRKPAGSLHTPVR